MGFGAVIFNCFEWTRFRYLNRAGMNKTLYIHKLCVSWRVVFLPSPISKFTAITKRRDNEEKPCSACKRVSFACFGRILLHRTQPAVPMGGAGGHKTRKPRLYSSRHRMGVSNYVKPHQEECTLRAPNGLGLALAKKRTSSNNRQLSF